MALLFESGQSLDAILSVMGLGANNNQEAELYHTQQSLQEIQAWWDLWKKHNQNVTFQMLAEVAETLKPTAYPDSGNIFLKKVREIWLTQRHIKSILVRSSSRPVMGQEGENRNENVKALALSLESLPAPTLQQKAQPHNTSQLQYRGSTPHAVLYLSIKPNSLSPYDIQHHHLCVYHDRQEPLHRQHLDDLAQILNNIYIVTQSTWKRVENSILSSHLFKRISQWIMEHHSRSNREGCIEFVREKRILRVRCRDSILVNVAYTMSKSDMPSMSDIIMTQKYCLWCSTPRCTLQCVSCKKVWYCGKDCQRQDWSNHKKLCKNKTMTILDHYNETSWKNIIHGTQAKLERIYKPLEGKTQQEQQQEQPGAINDIQNDGDDDDDLKESLFFHVHRYSLTQSQIQRSLKTWLNPVS